MEPLLALLLFEFGVDCDDSKSLSDILPAKVRYDKKEGRAGREESVFDPVTSRAGLVSSSGTSTKKETIDCVSAAADAFLFGEASFEFREKLYLLFGVASAEASAESID